VPVRFLHGAEGIVHGEEILLCLSTSFLYASCSMQFVQNTNLVAMISISVLKSRRLRLWSSRKQEIDCSSRSVNGIMSLTERLLHLGYLSVRVRTCLPDRQAQTGGSAALSNTLISYCIAVKRDVISGAMILISSATSL